MGRRWVLVLLALVWCSALWGCGLPLQSAAPTATPEWSATVAALQGQVGQAQARSQVLATQLAQALTPTATATPLPTPTGGVGSDGAAMDAYLRDLAAKGMFSGTVLVAQAGRVVLRAGYGLADADYSTPNAPATRFRLGSITKQFTAMGMLILQTRGQLALDDSICSRLAACPAAWQPVTIRHLLNHTSGIPNYTETPDFADREPFPTTPERIAQRVGAQPLVFAPGTGYAYSNANYVLLGMIIEQVSGQSYEAFLRAAIFGPLHMQDTGEEHARAVLPQRATGYTSALTETTALDLSNLGAAGALYSTVDDLYRWDRALATDQLIPAALREQMWTPVRETYGFGWRITREFNRRMVGHTGHVSGFYNYLTRFPEDDAVIIVLSNFDDTDVHTINHHLAGLLFHEPLTPITDPTATPES